MKILKSKEKKTTWYAGWHTLVFQLVLSPFYWLFEFIFKKKIITIVCHGRDYGASNAEQYRDTYDYVRCRTLGLVAEMIKQGNFQGETAEVGVFRGDFARRINFEFPDRKLFLYDTFEGFDGKQKEYDLEKGYTCQDTVDLANDFKSTSVKMVLEKMKYPESCIVRKGFFPDSAADDSNEIFIFVSIDVDLSEPILEALRFFYPRLQTGGYLFVHDYNCDNFEGVRLAVEKFEHENGSVNKVPLSDCAGTLVISK